MPQIPSTVAGILLYLAGVFLFAVNDALGKWLVADYTVPQLMLLRSVGALIVLSMIAFRLRPSLMLHGQWALHLVRILCMVGDTACFYSATITMPLADVMTFYMAAPLIITALSVFLLGEKVGIWRWTAVLVGFVGVVVALQPTSAAFSPAALLALAGATLFALAITVTRRLRDTHWLPLVGWQFLGAGLLSGMVSPVGWITPGAFDIGLMALVGIVAMLCFASITKALALAPASLLAPFQYTSIVWAALMGYLVWGDVPTAPIIVGNVIIVLSGLFVFYREAVRSVSVAHRLEPIP
jgi:S-adenosylmethionine uptake transporter